MLRRSKLRITLAALFFCLATGVSFISAPQASAAGGDCWLCEGVNGCQLRRFGFTQCGVVPGSDCGLGGPPCF